MRLTYIFHQQFSFNSEIIWCLNNGNIVAITSSVGSSCSGEHFFSSTEWNWLLCCKWEVKLCKCILLGHSRRDRPSHSDTSKLVSFFRDYCSSIWKHSILRRMHLCNPFFSQHPVPASLPTYPFNHSHIHLDFGSKREKDWITDWHNNSRKQSGVWEVGHICGPMGWCNEKQNFLTPELCDPLKPWNPASLFLAEFPPKPHTNLNVCAHTQAHTHNILPPTSPRILTDYLNFSARAVCLGRIEQMSRVISQRLINRGYCWGYWCPQIKAYLCHRPATPLEIASKCWHAAWINQWKILYHNYLHWSAITSKPLTAVRNKNWPFS